MVALYVGWSSVDDDDDNITIYLLLLIIIIIIRTEPIPLLRVVGISIREGQKNH